MPSPSPLGLLLDVDGPLASTETRTVPDDVLDALAALAGRGVPVVFNTGRSAGFVLERLLAPLRSRVDVAAAPLHAVCEKGAVWFPLAAVPADARPQDAADRRRPPAWLRRDGSMVIEAGLAGAVVALNDRLAGGLQPEDPGKLAMLSFEMAVGAERAVYEPVRDDVARAVRALLAERGVQDRVAVEPTVISVDVEDARSGKDLGVERARQLLAAAGTPWPARWVTAGDSRSDYAMADALHAAGDDVTHVDVRPADGVPDVPYPVLTARELAEQGFGGPGDVHERVGASLLRWALDGL